MTADSFQAILESAAAEALALSLEDFDEEKRDEE